MMKKNRGFTLIELLVTIAIIAILTAIVLSSVSQARLKAQDGKIQSQLAGMRTAAEVYYSSHGNKYAESETSTLTREGCFQSSTSLFGDVDSGVQRLASSTPNIICAATPDYWAAAAPLVSDTSLYWCVDNTGASRQISINQFPPATFDEAAPSCPQI